MGDLVFWTLFGLGALGLVATVVYLTLFPYLLLNKAKSAVRGKYGSTLVKGEPIRVSVTGSGVGRPGYEYVVGWEGVGPQGNVGGEFWMSETGRPGSVIDFRSLEDPELPTESEG